MDASSDLQSGAEELALILAQHGLQRMTARVLATLLFSDQPTMTMAGLADVLSASSGSISGALKTLTSVGLAERVPVPGSRRDHFRLRPHAWAVLFTGQNHTLTAMRAAADAGIEIAGRRSLAGDRLAYMRDFYAFLLAEIPELLDKWYSRADEDG